MGLHRSGSVKVHKVQAYTQLEQHVRSKCRGKGNGLSTWKRVSSELGLYHPPVVRGRDGPHGVTLEGQLEGTVWELTEDCRFHTGVGIK